ncbi:hypothetical protein C8Q75DRAFT_757032 [Abortiporus biennis]|nr:hypothetical protein C8Q75DRAFT_757032 [Abortiporus biennis]
MSYDKDQFDEQNEPLLHPEPSSDIRVLQERLRQDPRFNPPPPAAWKRVALLIGMVFLFWLAYHIRPQPQPERVLHANRYSKDYKFRPAASPIITEKLKDGRVRVRGAQPTHRQL